MDKARVAERFLWAVVSRDRARAMVGDLLEEHADGGSVRFWKAVAELFVAFAWRPVFASFLAIMVSFCFPFYLFVQGSRHLFFGQIHSPTLLLQAAQYVHLCGPLWTLAVFALVRFGVRNRLWWVSALFALIATGKVYTFWVPQLEKIIWVALALVIVFCLYTDVRRRSIAIVAVMLLLHWFVERTDGIAMGQIARHVMSRNVIIALSIAFNLIAFPLLEVLVCSSLYRRFAGADAFAG